MVKPLLEEHVESPGTEEPGNTDNTIVGQNLKRLRTRHGYSLERLAQISGVSRAMLSQIELGRSVPTINVVFKIARAFELPFSALLANESEHQTKVLLGHQAKLLTSASGEFKSRALFPFGAERKTEFYELRLSPKGSEDAEPHAPGTLENLIVTRGTVEIETTRGRHRLEPGDAILFEADVPHSYRNLADHEAIMYLVMTYAGTQG